MNLHLLSYNLAFLFTPATDISSITSADWTPTSIWKECNGSRPWELVEVHHYVSRPINFTGGGALILVVYHSGICQFLACLWQTKYIYFFSSFIRLLAWNYQLVYLCFTYPKRESLWEGEALLDLPRQGFMLILRCATFLHVLFELAPDFIIAKFYFIS